MVTYRVINNEKGDLEETEATPNDSVFWVRKSPHILK